MKKTQFQKIEDKIFKSRIFNKINDGIGKVNDLIPMPKGESWGVDIKAHTVDRKWTPSERKFLELTAGD
jgi:hypothetical protein|tara:strand:- start:12210 stop:12416 length:207 start_codon:yes stop_codon:yes gene_type:complete